ncbi:hypothetical protein GOP47_0011814 [Adiantum capillus-veneris]|uniref:Uncharacterized protein n=1 Tax=Adiantum capillus-veneris TaxID=13818 RepID=A0A9D4UTZ0_ADICA|nr:hypothetical protein GOP47_0011814 [Adiantum capillus-veneris]
MWLLLVVAGTGYLARCWQKSRKFRPGCCLLKCNVTLRSSQGSPAYTPRRGGSTTVGRRGLHKRSQSAREVGRKILHGRKEGKSVTSDLNDNLGFPDKVFDDSLCSEDLATPGEEKTSSLLLCMHGKNHHESFRSNYFCMKNIAANEDPTESASLGQLVHAVPACSDFLRDQVNKDERGHRIPLKLKKMTERACHLLAKVARGFGHRACSKLFKGTTGSSSLRPPNTRDVHVFKYLTHGKPCNRPFSDEKLKKQRFGRYFVHSQHLKELLDVEVFGHCRRCNHLPIPSSSNDPENAISCSADFAGLSMAPSGRYPLVDKVSGDWVDSFETASVFSRPMDCLHSFNEVSYVALGLAMGVLLVTTSRNNELEMILRKNNTLIQELKEEMDSKLERDPLKLLEVEKVPSGTTFANLSCSQKVHLPSEISSWPSRGGKDPSKFFNANNSHEANASFGFDYLEAELEAELQLIELNLSNTEQAECESKQIQFFQNDWQPEGDENGYVDNPEEDDTSYVDIDIYDPVAMHDAGQVHESDFVVPPLELERRLWQVLEQRHEERICELENDLRVTQETVTAKEMEVRWWKDRVLLLMETSLEGKAEVLHPGCLNV